MGNQITHACKKNSHGKSRQLLQQNTNAPIGNPKCFLGVCIEKKSAYVLSLFPHSNRQGIREKSKKVKGLKVSKSQKDFFLKLHCPKNEQNIR